MQEIRLNGHHIRSVESVLNRPKNGFDFDRFLIEKFYGKAFADKESEFVNSLPGDTVVSVHAGYSPESGVYVQDSICELGCPYSRICYNSRFKVLAQMFKINPFLFPIVLLSGLGNNDEIELMKRGLNVGEKYRLDEIVRTRKFPYLKHTTVDL